jgi:hypothetical protein
MVEAVNKQLKYRFLYHQHIANHTALDNYVEQAIADFNNRPHDVLDGLTPPEILNGKFFDKERWQQQMLLARTGRIIENKKNKCCSYSF